MTRVSPALSLLLASLAGCAILTTTPQGPQDKKKPAAAAHPDPQRLMADMMRKARPGRPHRALAALAGDWTFSIRMRMGPDAPWTQTTGKAGFRSVLGGRYLLEETAFEMMGMQFEGLQILGYDNLTQEYTALWMDTLSTWWVEARGRATDEHTIEYRGKMRDVITPQGRPYRMVVKYGQDSYEVSMFDTIDGKEVNVMVVEGRRAD